MKLFVSGYYPIRVTFNGKYLFFQRLVPALKRLGVTILKSPEKSDIQLHCNKVLTAVGGKHVVRFAGVYSDTTNRTAVRNAALRKAHHKADGVVYQSKHAKLMCIEHLGATKRPTAVVLNGADPAFYDAIEPASSKFEHTFVAVSRWRPFKRLEDIIESFLLADIPSSELVIIGDKRKSQLSRAVKAKCKSASVRFVGQATQESIASYLKIATAMIHICPYEGCPNVAVEAIVAGATVICTNVAGTPEVVGPSGGIVCQLDKPAVRVRNMNKPPPIDRSIVAQAFITSLQKRTICNEHVHIDRAAEGYLSLFRKVLGE